MWWMMWICYACNALSLLLLLVSALQGYCAFMIGHANHVTMSLLAIIFYLFTQTLVIFFFTGMGVNIRDYIKENGGLDDLLQRSKAIKFKLFSPLLLNMLGMSIAFIIGGAVHSHSIAAWAHGLMFWVSFIHYLKILVTEHRCFQENTAIVWAMTGVRQTNS